MAINLVTGYAGKPHVTSAEMALFNAGVCGKEKYVMQTNEMFAYTLNSSNSISIASGDLINQGKHFNIPINTSIDLTIENGKSGYHRIDAIVMRYNKDPDTAIESPELLIIKGQPSLLSTEAIKPAVTSGDIFSGDLVDDFVLYYVYIEELNITSVEKAFNVLHSISSLWAVLYPVGSIYMSVNPTNPSDIFGGTWEQIEDCFLYGAGTKKAGSKGGNSSITLTVNHLPTHSHNVPAHQHYVEPHSHNAKCSDNGDHYHSTYYRTDNSVGGSSQRVGSSGANSGKHNTSTAGSHHHTIKILDSDPLTRTSIKPETKTDESGEGEAINCMPPYLVVYIWKRIS